jgi:hypothetical protein
MIKAVGMGGLTTESRLALEHPNNIIAIALITIGWSKHKKLMTSESKFKTFLFLWIGIITYIE